jgi:hypothetical protein
LRDSLEKTVVARPNFAIARFQQGLNGYVGSQDTMIRADDPDLSNAVTGKLTVDLDDDTAAGNQPSVGMVRFNNIFGDGPGQIPVGATILSANLMVVTGTASGDNGNQFEVGLYRMLGDWSDASTWNSLNAGVSTDGTEASSTVDQSNNVNTLGDGVNYLVTSTVQAWANNPSANFGWALIATGTDGWRWDSSDATDPTRRPILEILYEVPPVPEPSAVALALIGIAVTWSATSRRRE